jgi:hypothetical protein
VPKVANRDREDRQRRKYDQLFGNADVACTAWEHLENGEVACHASKLVFATAVQCINHKRKQQYKVDLAASEFKEDENLMAELEKQAQVEKDRLHHQKYAVVKQRNIAKQDLRMEAARLAKANRQLEHDLLVAKSKIEKLQAQHDRQIEHVKSTYQRKIDKLARSLELKCKGSNQNDTDREKETAPLEKSQVLTPAAKLEAQIPRPCTLEGWLAPWGPTDFDAMAGLQRISIANPKEGTSPEPAVPDAVLQAFRKVRASMQPCLATNLQDCNGS